MYEEYQDKEMYVNFHMKSSHKQTFADDRMIFLKNVKAEVTQDQIKEFFQKFGNIIRCTVQEPKATVQSAQNRPKSKYAIITFQTEKAAQKAMGYDLKDPKLRALFDPVPYITVLIPKAQMKKFHQVTQSKMRSDYMNRVNPKLVTSDNQKGFIPGQLQAMPNMPQMGFMYPAMMPRGMPQKPRQGPYRGPNPNYQGY